MIQSLDRGLAIIESAGANGLITAAQAAQHLGVHVSSALRLIQTLEARGFLRRDQDGYRLGPALARFGSQLLSELDLRALARPHLVSLGALSAETVHLSQLTGHEILYVDKVESPHAVRMWSRVGAEVPAHCTGAGKAILAANQAHRAWLRRQGSPLTRYTDQTITSFDDLDAELDRIRATGLAVDDREHEDTIICLAGAIVDADGVAVGAISIAAPTHRRRLDDLRDHAPALLAATGAISRELGAAD